MPFQAPPNRAYGALGAIYASGGATLTLAAGHGARFGTLPAGSWFWVLIEDKNETAWARFMIAKVTAIAGDNLSITPAEDGTSNSNFPIAAGNPLQKVQVYAGHSIRQLRAMMDGGGAIIQATAPTLTVDSPKNLILTPAAPITVVLPTTGVWAGLPFRIVNLGSAANTITVNASGGTTVAVIPGGANLEIIAYQDAPTTNAHWGSPSSYLKSPVLLNPTLQAAGWPSFYAARTGSQQTVSSTNATEIVINDKSTAPGFDTNTNFDISTGRFTPTAAGKYLLTWHIRLASTVAGELFFLWLYRNGTGGTKISEDMANDATQSTTIKQSAGSAIVDMNGTTDYVSLWVKSATDASYTVEITTTGGSYFCGTRIA